MLMKTYKTARELYISEWEHENLVTVLRMLETGEIPEQLFSMKSQGFGCGTPACIGGWVARLQGLSEKTYVDSHFYFKDPLFALYWNERAIEYPCSTSSAAKAIRNFLVNGDPRWYQSQG